MTASTTLCESAAGAGGVVFITLLHCGLHARAATSHAWLNHPPRYRMMPPSILQRMS